MIKGLTIGHAAYQVSDMDKALEFYCDVLGCEKAFDILRDGKPWIIYIKVCKGQFVELFYGLEKNSQETSYKHLCLTVDDINDIPKTLEEHGYPMDSPPKQGSDGNWQCWASDPDGNRIEFMQIMPDSRQAKA